MPRPLTRSVRPERVPGGMRIVTGSPSSVGTLMSDPSAASAKVTGTSSVRLSPLRPNRSCGRTRTVTKRSPAGPLLRPGSPRPLSRMRWPVVHARRYPHLDLARPPARAGASAVGTRIGDDAASTATHAAGLAEREEPLVLVGDASAVAGGARLRHRARPGSAALAGLAGRVAREVDGRGDAVHRIGERQRQLGLEIGAAAGRHRAFDCRDRRPDCAPPKNCAKSPERSPPSSKR